jgi:hypothetical protein
MPGLVPGIHVFTLVAREDVDGRGKASGSDAVLRTAMPGHDDVAIPGELAPSLPLLAERRAERMAGIDADDPELTREEF